jgi:8-oxo-dGTP pyrophosphatase MutT (NUDIX family)
MIKGAGILFTDGHKILLLKRAEGDHMGSWGLPGGGSKKGESDINTAHREVEEECGKKAPGSRFGKFVEKGKDHDWTTFLYSVNNTFCCSLSEEHSDYRWIAIDKLDGYGLHPKLKQNMGKYLKKIEKRFKPGNFSEWLVQDEQEMVTEAVSKMEIRTVRYLLKFITDPKLREILIKWYLENAPEEIARSKARRTRARKSIIPKEGPKPPPLPAMPPPLPENY